MATSQNGWPIVPKDRRDLLDTEPLIRDITLPNGVLAGDVAYAFRWLARQWDRRVERLVKGWCWGWNVRKIEGSDDYSNHSSGTAGDFNAPNNPMGPGTTAKSLTREQIRECHEIEDESDGVFRWGGDFSRNDPMHWEINASRAAVSKFVKRLKGVPVEKPPVMIGVSVSIPVLKEGDRDDMFTGYNMITRIQRIVGADDDGVWGPKTTERIAIWCKLPLADCKVLTAKIACVILGLAR